MRYKDKQAMVWDLSWHMVEFDEVVDALDGDMDDEVFLDTLHKMRFYAEETVRKIQRAIGTVEDSMEV